MTNVPLAALPLVVVVTALLFRRSALTAALVGAGSAVLVGMGWFSLSSASMVSAASQWWPLIIEVLIIVAAGIAFAEVGRRTGAQSVLSLWLQKSLGSGVAPVLAIVHGVTPLIESPTGFGIGATLAIPLLVVLGLNGRRAATGGLLGLCAVPWGSMGPGMLIGAELGGVSFAELGVASAVASWVVFAAVGIGSVLVVAPGADASAALWRRSVPAPSFGPVS